MKLKFWLIIGICVLLFLAYVFAQLDKIPKSILNFIGMLVVVGLIALLLALISKKYKEPCSWN